MMKLTQLKSGDWFDLSLAIGVALVEGEQKKNDGEPVSRLVVLITTKLQPRFDGPIGIHAADMAPEQQEEAAAYRDELAHQINEAGGPRETP